MGLYKTSIELQFTTFGPLKTCKMRKSRNFAKIAPLFCLEMQFISQVQSTYAKDVLAQAATYHMGECLLGLQKPEQAMTLWTQFLKALPAGTWRGQARVAVADLLLDQLDLAGATEQIRQAAAILDNLPPGADSSWPESAPDIRLRQGILALLAGQSEVAVTATRFGNSLPSPFGRGAGGEGGRE